MKVLILASGRGTRISRYLSGKPKCTVDISGGHCLIEYTIDLLHSRGIQDIGIVLGYEAQVIREVLADKGVSFFYNPFYDVTNSIASAWFAKEFLTGDDLLIMNGDVYLEEKLLDRILAQGRSRAASAPAFPAKPALPEAASARAGGPGTTARAGHGGQGPASFPLFG